MAIMSFSCKDTASLFQSGLFSNRVKWSGVSRVAERKLQMLDAARNWNDLKIPPNNRPEHLSGNLKGYSSIRINSQWRVLFKWEGNHAYEVQIIDYH